MAGIVLADVSKVFDGGPPALDQVNLAVGPGEMCSLVGPSGCGKTTVLRILSGLDAPSAGHVFAGGRNVTRTPARERNFALITQQNQLVDTRTAGGNIRLPLDFARPPTGLRDGRELVGAEAAQLKIDHLLDRRPSTLSEGERRLVQLARCIIKRPSVLLMDEPLAHLEDDVRLRLRAEIMRIHCERELTTVMATAHQGDAMAMSDRIVVMFDGIVHQVGTPREVYDEPASSRIAAFFGEPGMNVLPAAARVGGGERFVDVLGLAVRMHAPLLDDLAGRPVLVGVRPEDLVPGGKTTDSIEVRVRAVEPLGRHTLVEAYAAGDVRIDCILPGMPPPIGTVLDLGLPADRVHLFDPVTGHAVLHPAPR